MEVYIQQSYRVELFGEQLSFWFPIAPVQMKKLILLENEEVLENYDYNENVLIIFF